MPEQVKNLSSAHKINVIKPSLPKGGGDLTGLGETFSPHEFSGSASLSIPIQATPCRDFEPHLSINYSSGTGNGPFGLGFELSLPSISRQTSKRIPQYNDSDTFLHSGDDYLVPELKNGKSVTHNKTIFSGTYTVAIYCPRTAASFSIIERYSNQSDPTDVFWVVTHADNSTSIFGYSDTAKIVDPQDPTRIFKWLLEETYDAKGNHCFYTYLREDGKNIPSRLTNSRDTCAQSYLSTISYGNKQALRHSILLGGFDPANLGWHFKVVFDYGQYNVASNNPNPYQAAREWSHRRDPFSDYRAGFEIRTYRLCHHVLLFHRFPQQEYGTDQPVLTNVLQLKYQQSPHLSLLTRVQKTGYYFTAKTSPAYQTKSLPPMDLSYSSFAPTTPGYTPHSYESFTTTNGKDLLGLSRAPDYQLVDLYGGGIPGVLYSDGQTVRYQAAQNVSAQGVEYSNSGNISFPQGGQSSDSAHTLTDVTGDGQLDLLVSTLGCGGFYQANSDGSWNNWQALESFPTDFHNPDLQHVDVTGDGLADLILIEQDAVRVYPELRSQGYDSALISQRPSDLPLSTANSSTQLLAFTDMCGLGQAQLVRISNGLVECWPNLGYGSFGQRVTLTNAPNFGLDFDTARLRLADLDGSGVTDLVYIQPNSIEIYLNQSGNSFAASIEIPLPTSWDELKQIQFADVRGNGTQCLVFSTTHPTPQQWFYDFNLTEWINPSGKTETISQKPYLLTQTQNNMGALTSIRYASSTKFFLQDQQQGLDWITRLPFPVQVIESVTHLDQVSKTSTVSSYCYHHGYYDGFEREFRGFGKVDRTDAKSFADFLPSQSAQKAAYNAAPVMTKTWYHTGAWLEQGDLLSAFQSEYWSGDSMAYSVPETTFKYLGTAPDADTLQQAHSALHGTVLRSEVYGNDKTPWQQTPYTVSESQFEVKQLQKKDTNPYAVFLLHEQESIKYDYERNRHDPRVSHHFVLKIDRYGHVLESAAISYPRRHVPPKLDPQTAAQQQQIRILYEEKIYTHSTGSGFYLLGIPQQNKNYEVIGLHPLNIYFSLSEFKKDLSDGATTKNLLSWERDYYYDAANQTELDLGLVSAQALHHRSEFIEFEKKQLAIDLKKTPQAGKFRGATFGDLPTLLTSTTQSSGGYMTIADLVDPDYLTAKDYYWNPGSAQSYHDANQFYLAKAFFDPFQYSHIKHGAPIVQSNVPRTSYSYDPYNLLVQEATDALNNTTKIIHIDYQHLAPTHIKDINGTSSGILLDPLGMVIVMSFYGSDYKTQSGFFPLNQYHHPSAKPTLSHIMQDPSNYLQNAASFFYYDLHSWMDHKIPIHFASLIAEDYPQSSAPLPIQQTITYSDGFGRHLQSKALLDSTEMVRYWDSTTQKVVTRSANHCWLTSGAVRYDDKGQPIQKYEPYFAPEYNYVDEQALNQVGFSSTLFSDSLGRNVLTVNPEGFITKTLFGSWKGKANPGNFLGYLNKTLYKSLPEEFIPSPWQTLHFDSNDTIKDSLCYKEYEKNGISPSPDIDGPSLKQTTHCFNTPMTSYTDPLGHTVQEGQFNVSIDESNNTFLLLDILGDQLTSADQRLHAAGKLNFKTSYNLSKEAVKTISVDGGTSWALDNVIGHPFWSYDSRGSITTHTFDALQRPVALYVQNPSLNLDQTVQYTVYGDSQDSHQKPFFPNPERHNLRGQKAISFDQSGLELSPFFSIHNQAQATGKVLEQDYKNEVRWDSIDDQTIHSIANTLDILTEPSNLDKLDIKTFNIPALENKIYATKASYDALGRATNSSDPDGNTTSPKYYRTGWLKSTNVMAGKIAQVAAKKAGVSANTPTIRAITYNAKGQHTSVTHGDIKTTYSYDPKNFRLLAINSMRQAHPPKTLQDLNYHHDPVGNVTSITDHAIPTVFFKKEKVEAKSHYRYDTLYRLKEATGREHTAMWQNLQQNQNNINTLKIPGAQPIKNGQALCNYVERYTYDNGGNLTEIKHHTQKNNLSREMIIAPHSNRLNSSTFNHQNITKKYDYDYDQHGNQRTLGELTPGGSHSVQWNYRDNMHSAIINPHIGGTSDTEYYVYDGNGHRVRKVRETLTSGVMNITESIYLGSFEIRREGQQHKQGPTTFSQQWHWSNVSDCRWGYLVEGIPTKGEIGYQLRYQLTNHLNSSTMELDDTGHVISYEEYYPYGGTAIVAAKSQAEVKQKYYRYSGKEEDATGLYYYGMRYYCPWLGRWTSPDPAGTVDGLNIYAFVGGNPITELDIGGMGKNKKNESSARHLRLRESTRMQAVSHSEKFGRRPKKKIKVTPKQLQNIADSFGRGTYAQSFIQNRLDNSKLPRTKKIVREVDHHSTDSSQRGDMKREDSKNIENSLKRAAAAIKKRAHRAHFSTKGGTNQTEDSRKLNALMRKTLQRYRDADAREAVHSIHILGYLGKPRNIVERSGETEQRRTSNEFQLGVDVPAIMGDGTKIEYNNQQKEKVKHLMYLTFAPKLLNQGEKEERSKLIEEAGETAYLLGRLTTYYNKRAANKAEYMDIAA